MGYKWGVIDLHVRVPATLAKKLKAQAEKNLRSVAAEITYLLTKGLK